jgi:hypothetical protein
MALDPSMDPLFHPDSELNRPGIAWSRADLSQYDYLPTALNLSIKLNNAKSYAK